MVENVTDTLRILDFPIAEQVIEVPKISCSPCPSRFLVPVPQSAEQFGGSAHRVVSHAHRSSDRGADRGHSSSSWSWSRFLSQDRVQQRRFLAFLSGIVEQLVDFPEQTVEQIVDIPGGGLQGSCPGQVSPASSCFHSPAGSDDDADVPGAGGLRTFPRLKKARSWLRNRVRGCPPVAAHPRRLLSWRARPCRTPLSGSSSGNATLASLTSGTDVLTGQSGRHQLVLRSCGSAKRMRREGSGTGTGSRVSTFDLPPLPPG